MHINGTNTVIAKKNGKAGINVAANSIESDYSILTVDGDGILNVTGTATGDFKNEDSKEDT